MQEINNDDGWRFLMVVNSEEKNVDIWVGTCFEASFEANQKDLIFISNRNNDKGYVIYLSDVVIDTLRKEDGIVAEKYKWYQTAGSSVIGSGLTEYKENYPLNSYEFTADEIKCESYLQKIIDSFQK